MPANTETLPVPVETHRSARAALSGSPIPEVTEDIGVVKREHRRAQRSGEVFEGVVGDRL